MRFFDTNVLVYAASTQDERKRHEALELLRHALEENHDGVISLQILQVSRVCVRSWTLLYSPNQGIFLWFWPLRGSQQ